MTDSHVPPPEEPTHVDPDVVLASAHLDGELEEAEQARVDADPAVAALALRFSDLAHEIRDVPPPPADLVDHHVTAAVAVMDESEAAPADGGQVVPLAGRGIEVPWWRRVPLGAVAAVAAVIALVGAVGLASTTSDDGADTAAESLDSREEASEDSAADAGGDVGEEGTATFDAPATAGDGAAPARPSFSSVDELAASLRPTAAPSATGSAEAGGDEAVTTTRPDTSVQERDGPGDPCDAVPIVGVDPATVEQVLPALVGGDPVTAVVHVEDGRRQLAVVADATCAVVAEREL